VDLCGIPKDRYYLYKSYWKPEENTIHVLPHWNWEGKEGENIPVFVYTNGDCAELFLNDKTQGKRCKDPKSEKSVDRFRLMWKEIVYEPGEIKVIAYKEGMKIGEAVMKTAGKPHELRLTPDRKTIIADGEDLSYILVEAVDKDGIVCPVADNRVEIEITGPGKLAGVGNGNPQSFNSFQSDYVYLFYGKAMIIIGSDGKKGESIIKISSQGIGDGKTEILIR
jgi:beta-galactosidase